ncbi:9350_t:CDS:2 [Entrophospora sp. SA101]|nr:9350_t:CDS:2 [Entrophospora sp. SA101]CAJ0923101.1 1924_t:CDS:2 [Entrophospora sp. SA101]
MSDSTFISTEQPDSYITGHVNNLTKDQNAILRLCWYCLFLLQDLDDLDKTSSTNNLNNQSCVEVIDSTFRNNNFKKKIKEYNTKHPNPDKSNEFFELISSLESYEPGELRKTLWSFVAADDPDVTILRFLRARKWNVERSLSMFAKTINWMSSFGVRDIIEGGEEGMSKYFESKGVKNFMNQFSSDEQPLEVLQKFTIYVMETTRLFIQAPVETGCLVFNMTDFSLSNMDFQYVKFMIQCFEAYYPESLGILIIHKAPWVFGQVWKLIAPLLDPVVASKIRFTKEDKDILAFIPESHLIEELGGKDKWKYEARTLYHRTGILKEDGACDWGYSEKIQK